MSNAAVDAGRFLGNPAAPAASFNYIEAIAKWCEGLQGRQPLVTALRQVAIALGAQSACLSRHARAPIRAAQVVAFQEPEVFASGPEAGRSFAHCVLGAYVDRPRPASVWLSSLADERNDPALLVFQEKAGIAETVIIALALEEKRIDYLELHFQAALDAATIELLDAVASALSRIWITRKPGLFAEAILSGRSKRAVSPVQGRLLSTANPARLSRAEFRICLLLSQGLNQVGICNELSISPATYRTHLRNVLRKTGVSTLPELLYALLSPVRPEEDFVPLARSA
ncbi:helix-turn-helix transcriptional regulator [Rubellimicrobium roseum]|uniref:HTH luxR-type domain-containing protein n=1 Tax=Rubellimicrobium roseum TaxID=687525 RepID=A0A5C4N8V7_9RHOB|nr:LuxR family transcriptional regulator [Rubellimicrobium roseum]TNC66587.1 hypothetical protein FHG71_16510 [Rubellimicrobium roseum]